MTKKISLVDPNIHVTVRESLATTGLRLSDSPDGVSAVVTQDRDIDEKMLEAAGQKLEAIFLLEPGQAKVAATKVPVHSLGNPALLAVAEHTVMLMLALGKRLPWILDRTGRREWAPDKPEPTMTTQKHYCFNWIELQDFGTLGGRTVGLVGLGYIGKATAKILNGFSAKVCYYKPNRLPAAEEAALGVEWLRLDSLLEQSDFVSLHHRFVDGPEGNDKQFGTEAFRRMKPTAFFINTARGRLVAEDDLAEAVDSGQIAGAALDVFRYEPLPDDHPFFRLPPEKMILTPHLGGVPMKDAGEAVTRQIIEVLAP
jgi:phosphoglycerate dehydrogenase-like enzyme